MNFLLEKKFKYVVLEPFTSVQSQLKSIINTPWYDLAVNLSGKMSNDGNFRLYSKFSLGFKIFNMPQNIAIITGKLEEKVQDQTIMNVVVRPSYALSFVLYFVLAIFLFKLGRSFRSNEEHWILTAFLFFSLIFLRSLIYISMEQLRNRFEKVMSVAPEEIN